MGKAKIDLDLLRIYLKQGKSGAECSRLFKVSEAAISKARKKLASRQGPQQHIETRTLEPVKPVEPKATPKPELNPLGAVEVAQEPVPDRRHKLDKILDHYDGGKPLKGVKMGFFDCDEDSENSAWSWMK